MTLQLDRRQRAMLLEMGIRVWAPLPPAASPAAAPATATPPAVEPLAPTPASPAAAPAPAVAPAPVSAPVPAPVVAKAAEPAPAPATVPAPAPAVARRPTPAPTAAALTAAQPSPLPEGALAGWTLSPPRPWNALQQTDAPLPAPGTAWLLVVEGTSLRGDAQQLLGSLLQAIQLPPDMPVWVSVVHTPDRMAPAAPEQAPDTVAVVPPWQLLQPRLVMTLGLTAARAALRDAAPLNQLRARLHHLPNGQGAEVPAVVSYDAPYLLRAPRSRAQAWLDWCQARALVVPHA